MFLLFQLLPGNTNTFTIVDQRLDPPVIASKIRFLPYSDHVRTVCMRTETRRLQMGRLVIFQLEKYALIYFVFFF
jgi:hypothetical protein